MGESHHRQATAAPSRLGMRSGGGEIVEVQGGHIVRSTGRKDRHSKVCTAKGPRDRRVRLSAHTAIQFYDVQDRLGYDRPSKAVDWLIKKAKAAIDELAELPAWNPATSSASPTAHHATVVDTVPSDASRRAFTDGGIADCGVHGLQHEHHVGDADNPTTNNTSSFLPPSLDSDAIADTIKSFFPMGASAEATSSSMQFQSYPPDLLSRTSSQNQDLRLSLHSFHDPMLLHHHHHHHHPPQPHQTEQVLFSGAAPLGFDGYQPAPEIGRFQRMVAWNAGADSGSGAGGEGGEGGGGEGGGGGGGGGFVFSPPSTPTPPLQQLLGCQNQFFSQRGPLQSSNTPSIRGWIDPAMTSAATTTSHQRIAPFIHQSSIAGMGFASGGFSGFHIPARIQGEEEHDGIPNKPSSACSESRH